MAATYELMPVTFRTTQRTVVILYRRFGIFSHFQGSKNAMELISLTLKMRPTSCFETSARNCH